MLNSIILFVIGFYILTKGANLLIDGSSSLAKKLNVPNWTIGVLLVGIGTSIPELSINLVSLFRENEIGLGTLIGSSTFDILVVLGAVALITPLVAKPNWVKTDFLINIFSVLIILVLAYYLPTATTYLGLSYYQGLFVFFLFLAWLVYMVKYIRPNDQEESFPVFALSVSIIMVLAGIAGVYLGGEWVVDGGEQLALFLGASPALIGLTLVGIGTSIPELTVSLLAAWKRNTGIAIGNILGSTIFDFLGILGIMALFGPVAFPKVLQFDLAMTLLAAVLLFVFMFVGKKYTLTRGKGLLMIFVYLLYFIFISLRG